MVMKVKKARPVRRGKSAMSNLTTSQKHAHLGEMGKRVAKDIFSMLELASEILADHQYVDQFGGEAQLIEYFERHDFEFLKGAWALRAMLLAFAANPKRSTWQEYGYSVQAMIDLSTPAKDAGEVERINWKALAKELQAKLAQAEAAVEEYRKTNADLRARCDTMLAENGELRGRVAVLESFTTKGRAA